MEKRDTSVPQLVSEGAAVIIVIASMIVVMLGLAALGLLLLRAIAALL